VFEVRVNGLRFRGPHGVFESEREAGNAFVASICLVVDGGADLSDQLGETVDYSAVAALMGEVSGSRRFLTVEGLAGAFAEEALARFPLAVSVEVALDKIAPVGVPGVESCGVKLRRDRR
jgi:dihydroneopterin aldolase